MKPRLRLPAYGKQLLNERRQGRHPLVVHVVYGETMHHGTGCDNECAGGFEPAKLPIPPAGCGSAHPHLWVKPSEFKPWTVDWHCVTGCLVAVFDLREDWLIGSRNFYELLGEIGRFAGPVQVYRLEAEKPLHGQVVAWHWAFYWLASRVAAPSTPADGGKWPDWWPEETERKNAERRGRWAALWGARHEQRAEAAA